MNAQQFFHEKQQTIGVTLNAIQQQAVQAIEGPLLLLASPGSGKTTTIIMRIGYMMEVLNIPAHKIKAVTFSKASAQDMMERFHQFFPHLPQVAFSTIHSLAYEIVRRKLAEQAISYTILSEQEGGQGISKKRILRELFEQMNKTKITEDQLDELMTYISFVKNKLLPRKEWAIAEVKVPKKIEIFEAYETFKQAGTEQLLIDFDDMLVMANAYLKEDATLRTIYQQKFDYFLTDESQDTSLVQHKIVEQLVAKHENICVVADEDQSIYSWRGADPEYLLKFEQTYKRAKILMMTQNYRSTNSIVHPANEFIKRNKKRFNKQMFTENEQGNAIKFQTLKNYDLQASYIAKRIEEDKIEGTTAILFRNNTSAIPLIDALDRANISFYMKDSSIRFFTHWVVEDVLNFMRLAYNPRHIGLFEKIYRKMNGYITPSQFDAIRDLAGDEDVFTKLLTHATLKDYQPDYIKALKRTYFSVQFDKTPPSEMLEMIRKNLGYEKALKKTSEALGFNYDSLIDILDSLALLTRFTPTMTDFANRLKQLEQLAKTSFQNRTNSVVLSTLHSSKGLEFERVFIVDLVEGVFPNIDDKGLIDPKIEAELEEETRLFYVGITRAINELELITYTKRFTQLSSVSRFVRGLDLIVNPVKVKPKSSTQQVKKTAKQYRNEKTILSADQLYVGQNIKHVLFGEGVIMALGGNTIELDFDSTVKKFLVDTCLEQGYLERSV